MGILYQLLVNLVYLKQEWGHSKQVTLTLKVLSFWKFTSYCSLKVDPNEAIFLSYMTIYDGLMVSHT